jgi:hypothetical protein
MSEILCLWLIKLQTFIIQYTFKKIECMFLNVPSRKLQCSTVLFMKCLDRNLLVWLHVCNLNSHWLRCFTVGWLPCSEAAEAFRKWRGIGQKGHFCIWSKWNDFTSFTSRTKIFENIYGVSITSEMAFTDSLLTAKRALSFQQKESSFKKYVFRSLNRAL